MSGHRVLVVEDDPVAQQDVLALIASRGDKGRIVATVSEALAALDEEDFCYFIVDQQLPARPGDRPLVAGGEWFMTECRKRDDRRVPRGRHVTPMLVLTGYSEHHEFVSLMYDLGADEFATKPATEKPFLDKVRTMLDKVGRGDHDSCAALRLPRGRGGAGSAAVRVRLVLDGVKEGARTGILVNGERVYLIDSLFFVVFRLAVAHVKEAGAWSSRDALGIGRSRDKVSAIGRELRGVVPEGFVVIEGDRSKNFRLNPAMEVVVEWGALEKHSHQGVQRGAREWGRR